MPQRDPRPSPAAGGEPQHVGLCGDCRHARRVESAKGSVFWLCERAAHEPTRYAKYPRLPVARCVGYQTGRSE